MSPRRQLLTAGETLRQPQLADALDRRAPGAATASAVKRRCRWSAAPAITWWRIRCAGVGGTTAAAIASTGFVVGDADGNARSPAR